MSLVILFGGAMGLTLAECWALICVSRREIENLQLKIWRLQSVEFVRRARLFLAPLRPKPSPSTTALIVRQCLRVNPAFPFHLSTNSFVQLRISSSLN
jgi:hypothetical protein